ncbi:MAG: hypothetical protein KDI48_02555 [Xanthomonadales bacterium]|nr:hypothetical protein [Xanthomonadales bacterium]
MALILAGVMLSLLATAVVRADSYDERRMRAGARLFRALLVADLDLRSRAAEDGELHVVLLGANSSEENELRRHMLPQGDAPPQLGGLPMQIEVRELAALDGDPRPAAVFIARPLGGQELAQLVQWSRQRQVVLYSPFEGDVERGVMAGLSVEAKVLPYLNQAALEAAGVSLKPLFLKVAKVHQP